MRNPKLSIYVATQGMRACNNNNMRNPSLNPLVFGLHMLLLLHAEAHMILINNAHASSPVLLHIYLVSGYA